MIKWPIILVILLVLPVSVPFAQDQPSVGDKVPAFKLPYATKDTIDFDGIGSDDLAGTTYVLAFYPAAWSSGCTKEVCAFRDAIADFEQLDIQILPVSGDYVFTQHEWAKHHNLPFKLLADQTREFGKKLGVYLPDRGMFKRSVFVVRPDGRFTYIDVDYSVADDSDFKSLREAVSKVPSAGK